LQSRRRVFIKGSRKAVPKTRVDLKSSGWPDSLTEEIYIVKYNYSNLIYREYVDVYQDMQDGVVLHAFTEYIKIEKYARIYTKNNKLIVRLQGEEETFPFELETIPDVVSIANDFVIPSEQELAINRVKKEIERFDSYQYRIIRKATRLSKPEFDEALSELNINVSEGYLDVEEA